MCTISITNGTIDLSDSKQDLSLAMNPKEKLKENLVVDVYASTSVAAIFNGIVDNTSGADSGNFHVEVSLT